MRSHERERCGRISTGHVAGAVSWLDAHFESARAEYQQALRFVGIQPFWRVLDAGCRAEGYLPLLCEQVGSAGRVSALDLAPENVAQVRAWNRLFADATFDCVWCANVAVYLTEAEFTQVVGELRRRRRTPRGPCRPSRWERAVICPALEQITRHLRGPEPALPCGGAGGAG